MKKILIADDEKTIRDGIEKLICSTGKYEVIGKCKNGEEALSVAKKTSPDIIITDIRMPVMDGLEFISEYSKIKEAKFIILSGFGEFEYARTAHKLNVFDYVLKPVDYGKFLETVANAAEAVDKSNKSSKNQLTQLGLLVLQHSLTSKTELTDLLNSIDIDFTDILPVVISFEKCIDIPDEELNQRKDYISNFFESKGIKTIIPLNYDKRIVLFIYNQPKINIKSLLINLHCNLEENFGYKSYYGLSSFANSFYDIKKYYNEALFALSYCFYNEEKYIYEFDSNWESLKNCEIYYYKEKNLTANAIKELDKDKAFEYVENIFKKGYDEKYPPQILYYFTKDLFTFCYNTVYSYKSEYIKSIDIQSIMEKEFHNYFKIDELKSFIFKFITETINTIDTRSETTQNNVIEDVIKYLNLNYKQEISLDSISNTFFINKSYFCKIFKEATNTTFNTYLTTLRINKAKKLILEDKLKIYEISEMVGFKDPKYFAKTFKDITGLTPSEYKQQNNIISL